MIIVSCSPSSSEPEPDDPISPNIENPFDPDNPTGCIAIDTDGDGILDCQDPDIDNDGFVNELDAFPLIATEWIDTDGDGFGDNTDWSPTNPAEWNDNDQDTIGDNADEDDDNDGIPDIFEPFFLQFDSENFYDVDGDLLGDQENDADRDNDGVPDIMDKFQSNPLGYFDIDGDRDPNNNDSDIDGDGFLNASDAFPYNKDEWYDDDFDLIGNNIDPDDDNDGFPDSWESFPRLSDKIFDTDGDGYANNEDDFPFDPFEWIDSDDDGVGDNGDPFPNDPTESRDTDLDGIGDNSDADADNDGFLNCVPLDAGNTGSCAQDAFPRDRTEWFDNDVDLIGDNADEDDDNDGIPDIMDIFPKDNKHFSDFDQDLIPDATFAITPSQRLELKSGRAFFTWDEDTDNDGVPNIMDDLKYNSSEYFDIDGDFIGAKLDLDDDGDGVADVQDLFPYNENESTDNDLDGLGDNIDADDDSDGLPDLFDDLPENSNGYSDFDGDGRPDQNNNNDIDGDGIPNDDWLCTRNQIDATTVVYDCGFKDYTVPSDINQVCDYPRYTFRNNSFFKDLFIWDENEFEDHDIDCLADNEIDEDDDNDGVPDIMDAFPRDSVNVKRYFDSDQDGIANITRRTLVNGDILLEFDEDIDNDGVINFGYECKPKEGSPQNIVCEFLDLFEFRDENGVLINTAFYDAFPYDPNESKDEDKDRIGDNSDPDADNDGFLNCVPIDINSSESCNQDELPLVGQFNSFISEEFDIDPNNIIPYCADFADCYYRNYDRDNDGLTDFEEYNLGTNPEDPDTDGDTVPDIVERDEFTDPLDPNDLLDEDNDGIPNFFDKTPKGAFDEFSLTQQVQNASSCLNRNSEELCLDGETNLCEWKEVIPEELVEEPEGSGNFVPRKSCQSKNIIVTEDIELNNCINFTGEVKITAQSKKTITFSNQLSQSPRCSGAEISAINGASNSELIIDNINFDSESVDNLILMEGRKIYFNEVGIRLLKTDKLPTTIVFDRAFDGDINIQKSTIRSITDGTITSIKPHMNLNVDLLTFKGNIFHADLGDNLDNYGDNYISFKTNANTANFEKNIFYQKAETDDVGVTYPNSYAWEHTSRIETNLIEDNYINSSFLSVNFKQNYPIIDITKLFTSQGVILGEEVDVDGELEFVPEGSYSLDGNANETAFYSDLAYKQFFENNNSLTLSCSESAFEVGDRTIDVHPAYLAPTPLSTVLNIHQPQVFNSASTNLTPEGVFDFPEDFNLWNNLLSETNQPVFPGGAVFNAGNGNITINPANPDRAGIGKQFTNIIPNRAYQLKFLVNANNPAFKEIKMRVSYLNKDRSLIKNFTIEYDPTAINPRRETDENGNITYFVNYENNFIDERFIPNDNEFFVLIENTTSIESNPVDIDDIEVLESLQYEFQYPGINIKFCE